MTDKTFIVTHAKAIAPITITGKTLKSALIREGLDPNFWKEKAPDPGGPEPDNGEDTRTPGPEDN